MNEYKQFLDEINGKNINFLIGSGASNGLIPTLWLPLFEKSFEELLIDNRYNNEQIEVLYYLWFKYWIAKTLINEENSESSLESEENNRKTVMYNYNELLINLINILNNEGFDKPKRINIFTTNYDTLFEYTFDKQIKNNNLVYFNDGSNGFLKKYVSSENYFISASHSGINDNFSRNIPVINLLKIHGSVTWIKDNRRIQVSNENKLFQKLIELSNEIEKEFDGQIEEIFQMLTNKNSPQNSIETFENKLNQIHTSKFNEFKILYDELPIVNPTKKKFEETVFQQHYYQMLRMLSYELERKNTVLIVFGFSFADEHILEIVRRSLSNPHIKVYIICYSNRAKLEINEKMLGIEGITYYPFLDDIYETKGDFKFLNKLLRGWK